MSEDDLEFLLPGQNHGDGIKEADFQNWKHHPVSKVFFRFLADYAQHVRMEQIDLLNGSKSEAPTQWVLGQYNGRFNAFAEMSVLQFDDLGNFYPTIDEKEESE